MKNVVITGASGGMGLATAKLLSQQGFNVFALDSKPQEEQGITFVETDVTKMESIQNAFLEISKKTESIDAIIHFAGIYKLNSLVEIDEDQFMQIFNINLFGVYRINKTFLPLLKQDSRIVITSSELASLEPLPFTGIYAITKSALEKYAYSLRMELQLLGIKVCVVRPGAVCTGMLSASTKQLEEFCLNTKLYKCNAKRFKQIVDKVETKNIQPQKIANLVLKILKAKNPKYVYNINRNAKLKLLNAMPKRLQTKIIKNILKTK